MPSLAGTLPDFPWDTLIPYAERARAHPGGIVDLSIGTPVDPTPALIQAALASASNAPGYPTAHGTAALREAAAGWLARRLGVTVDPLSILPTIGSKELVAWLPTFLGLGAGDTVVYPEVAYPTYAVGVTLAGAEGLPADLLTAIGPRPVKLLWLNSPGNPTGQVLPVDHLRKVVAWARERDVIVASDECYIELGWDGPAPVSILHPSVCGDSHQNLLAVHSLSKRSNLAGYRAGLVSGDPVVVAELLQVRKHGGLLVPLPVQAAMIAALGDDTHVEEQRERYARRRALLRPALESAGFRIERSEAGLYLWCTRGEPASTTLDWLSERGIVAAPGTFYGAASGEYVRFALTATDERMAAAAGRLRTPTSRD